MLQFASQALRFLDTFLWRCFSCGNIVSHNLSFSIHERGGGGGRRKKKSVCKKGLIQSKQPFRGADVGVFCSREPNEGVLGSKRRGFSLHFRSGEVWHKVTDSRRSVCPCSPLEGFSESSPPTQETLVICLLPETRWISPV